MLSDTDAHSIIMLSHVLIYFNSAVSINPGILFQKPLNPGILFIHKQVYYIHVFHFHHVFS
jgi:hypothetical protein